METLNAPDALFPSVDCFTVNLKKQGKVGFGLDITGGQEYGSQVTISRIDRRGPADGHLQVGDEIHYVNGVRVIGATGYHVTGLVKNAELLGEVDLAIHRNLARSEHAVLVTTSNTMPQQSYLASMELPHSTGENLRHCHGIPAQRSSDTEAASDGSGKSTAKKQTRKGPKGKSVVVFKSGDVTINGSTVLMPNTIEMAQIKKPHTGQFKSGVQISSKMTAADIEKKLKEIFTILRHERFYCASYSVKEGNKLLFHGAPSVWDGKSIKQRIKGNSALYILIEVMGTTQIISQVMQSSMHGTRQMNSLSDSSEGYWQTVKALENSQHFLPSATGQSLPNPCNTNQATAPAPGEATMQIENMPEIRPQDLDVLDTFLHSQSCKDVLQELQNCNDLEAMDTSQPMNTEDMPLNTLVPSGDELGLSDPSDSGHGQSDKAEERSQEDIPSVPSGACPPVRPEMRERKSIVDMIVPNSSPLQGGMDFVLMMSESLPPNMDSAVAFFGSVPVQVTKHGTTLKGIVPPSDEPGTVTVTVQSTDGIFLGNIFFEYVDADETYLKRLVKDPKLLQKFYMQMAEEQGKKTRESEKQPNLQPPYIVTTAGSSQAFHILATFVFAAAKYDALEPIKIILDSSNGSAVFHAYKDCTKLPESVARDHGNDDIANYLEEVTYRFYEEIKCGKECNKTVDWLELLNAAGEDQTRLNHDTEERDIHHLETDRIRESGYSADVESSSCSSSDPEGSDSERHTSTSSFEDIETRVVDVGNATQHEKNHPADTNAEDTLSSFTFQEVTNLPVEFKTTLAEDSTVVTSAGKEGDIMPSTKGENSVNSLAANQSGRSPSPEKESGATQSVTEERDITFLVATERNVTPSAERGSDFTPSTGCDGGENTAVPLPESTSDAVHANSKENAVLQLAKKESDVTPTKLEEVAIPPSAERDSEATPANSKENTVPPLAEGKSDGMHANSKESTVLQSAECKSDATSVKSKKPDVPQLAEQKSDVASLLKREIGVTPSAAVNNDVMPVVAIERIITQSASGESNSTLSAEDESDFFMPSSEDESNITPSAKDDSDITPSTERERSVTSSAAEQNNIMSSSHKKSVFMLSDAKEVDLEPLVAKARDFKPSNAEGTVESNTSTKAIKDLEEEKKECERRLAFPIETIKGPKEETKDPERMSASRLAMKFFEEEEKEFESRLALSIRIMFSFLPTTISFPCSGNSNSLRKP